MEGKSLNFQKYQGTGNDFILIDDRAMQFDYSQALIAQLCDRRFGIGSDGLLLLRNKTGVDFEMLFFNPDGSRATFCGNGARCIVAFAASLGIGDSEFTFQAADGLHKALLTRISGSESLVRVSMIDPLIYSHSDDFTFLNSGTYHYVTFVPDPNVVDLMKDAPKIRYSRQFEPAGTNVNYAAIQDDGIYVRTYEKGVEAETLSCGTGVTATAIAASLHTGRTDQRIRTKGGILRVTFKNEAGSFSDVRLEGPAVKVFEGKINL